MKGFPTDMKPTEMVQWALDAAAAFKSVQQALKLKKPEPSKNDGDVSEIDGVTKNPDGTVTIRRSFSLDPQVVAENSHPAAQKTDGNTAMFPVQDGIPVSTQDESVACCDGKGHDTPLENCKAKYPMACPYHGIKAMEKTFLTYLQYYGLAKDGGSVPYAITKKPSGAFQISVTCPSMYGLAAENAIKDFLKQAGFKGVDGSSEGLNEAGTFEVSQAFKQDKAKAPDDLSMLQEWQEALLDDEEMLGSDKHLELLSMLAELDGVNSSEMTEAQQKLLSQAQEAYHQLKAASDFKDIASEEAAYAAAAEMTQACDGALAKAKKLHDDVWVAKKKVGFSSSPKGFPGNQEYNDAYYKMFPLNHSSQKEMYDSGKVELANEALVDALAAGDFDKAKQALYDLAYAKDLAERHSAAFVQHAEAMKKNFAKFQDTGLDADAIAHNSFKKNQAIFAAHGLAYPEELQKEIDEAVSVNVEQKANAAKELASEVVMQASQAESKAKKSGKNDDAIVATVSSSDEILKPLAHDEAAFPKNVTQKMLEDALKKGDEFDNSGSGLKPTKVTIGNKSYVLKKADEKSDAGKAIRNGHAADMAYRAGGIHAPDSMLYTFGGKVYKLSEFVSGTRLDKIMAGSDEQAKAAARQSLLKGFPLDALFSNWDVLGTNSSKGKHFSNVIIDKNGNAYRIDNDGAFDATGLVGGKKNCHNGNFLMPVSFENWEKKGGWKNRAWIDDFRTMRMEKMNQGVFDGYSTADIFIAAGNINMAAACATLPSNLQHALKKPLLEMNQMATHAVSAAMSGIKDKAMLSQALDTMYEASKRGFRKMCQHAISWGSGGFGKTIKDGTVYTEQPFEKPKPEPPKNPMEEKNGQTFSNEEYTGSAVGTAILNAAKTINHHAGYVQKDAQGNVLGHGSALPNPDYAPNANTMATFDKVNRDKLAKLSETDDGAKHLLSIYDAILSSKANGYKVPIGHVAQTVINSALPKGFKTKEELAFEKDQAGEMAKYHAAYAAYQKDLSAWQDEKKAHDKAEHEKAVKSGKNEYDNFYHFADELLKKGIDTNGIEHGGAEGIDIIEYGKHCNKYGGGFKGANTHNDSWTPPSSKLKVLEHVFRGMTLDQIDKIKNSDPLINNGHFSGSYARKWFNGAIKEYQEHPDLFARDCRTYACWKGLQTLKLENESSDLIRHDTHSVGLNRKDSYEGEKGTVTKIQQKAANTSCGFQSNGCINHVEYVYDVPFWNVTYTYNDANKPDSQYESHEGSEHEWVATLIGLTPFCPHSGGYAATQAAAMATPEFEANAKKRKDRLAPFMTAIKDVV